VGPSHHLKQKEGDVEKSPVGKEGPATRRKFLYSRRQKERRSTCKIFSRFPTPNLYPEGKEGVRKTKALLYYYLPEGCERGLR